MIEVKTSNNVLKSCALAGLKNNIFLKSYSQLMYLKI